MKLVDIDKCDREVFYKELGTKDGKDVCIFAETVFDMLEALPPVNAIPIPEGATNGDVIKAMFPNCKDWKAKIEDNDGEIYEVHFVQLPNSMTINKYEESWWNAPYKK